MTSTLSVLPIKINKAEEEKKCRSMMGSETSGSSRYCKQPKDVISFLLLAATYLLNFLRPSEKGQNIPARK